RSAEGLALRHVEPAVVAPRLGLRLVVPVELRLELLGERRRNLDVRVAVLPSGLEQEDPGGRVLGKAVGKNTAGGAGPDDHIVRGRHGRTIQRRAALMQSAARRRSA